MFWIVIALRYAKRNDITSLIINETYCQINNCSFEQLNRINNLRLV